MDIINKRHNNSSIGIEIIKDNITNAITHSKANELSKIVNFFTKFNIIIKMHIMQNNIIKYGYEKIIFLPPLFFLD